MIDRHVLLSSYMYNTTLLQELRGLRAKFRPRLPSEDGYLFRPAQGRDTTTGALVATKEYLERLEGSINGLVQRLQHSHNDDEGERSIHNRIQLSVVVSCTTTNGKQHCIKTTPFIN